MSYPRFLRSRQAKTERRTSGHVTLNGTTWAQVDSTNLSHTITEVQVGDLLMASVSAFWGNEAVEGLMDAATIVSSTITNVFSIGTSSASDGTGQAAWRGPSGVYMPVGGSAFYVVQAGDLSSGSVTVAVIARTYTASNKTLRSGTGTVAGTAANQEPIQFTVVNLGPVQA